MIRKLAAATAAITTITVAIMAATTAYAGQWVQDGNGWWWQNDDRSYPKAQWQWIDGNGDGTSEKYYFDGNGYLLTNTTTPDGYQVNNSGAWTLNNVVQVKVQGSDGLDDWNDDWEIVGHFVIPNQDISDTKTAENTNAVQQEDIDPYELAYRVAELVNEEREARGKAALEINDELMGNAAVRAEEADEVFSHTRPDGSRFETVITVKHQAASENLQGGGIFADDTLENLAKQIVGGWLNSPGHKRNLMKDIWKETGVGVYITGGGENTTGYTVIQVFIER